jgi:septum site-determining protein MinD
LSKIVAIHSYKGGTGKSLITLNLAVIYANEGKNVLLLDLDLRAPSLQDVFKLKETKFWINDYLNGKCSLENVVLRLDQKYKTKGRFYVGLADSSIKAIQEMTKKDKEWEMRSLRRLLGLKDLTFNNEKIDLILIDTSPGVQYSSVNTIAACDTGVVLVTIDESDMDGAKRMVRGLYNLFEKKTGILLNKVPISLLSSEDKKEQLIKRISLKFNLPVLGALACYCEIVEADRSSIFVLEEPKHPFTRNLSNVAERIRQL